VFFHIGNLVTFLCSIGTVPCTSFQQCDLDSSEMNIIVVACCFQVTVEELGYVLLRAKSACVLRQTRICGVWSGKSDKFWMFDTIAFDYWYWCVLGNIKKERSFVYCVLKY